MTPDRITELAKQAGGAKYVNRHYPDRPSWGFMDDQLQRFAELVWNELLRAVQMEVAQSPLISNVDAAEVQAILRRLK